MAAEYDGYGRAELADHIAGSITRRTGRVWDKEAEAQLSVWFLDSANRAMAVEWLVYIDACYGLIARWERRCRLPLRLDRHGRAAGHG